MLFVQCKNMHLKMNSIITIITITVLILGEKAGTERTRDRLKGTQLFTAELGTGSRGRRGGAELSRQPLPASNSSSSSSSPRFAILLPSPPLPAEMNSNRTVPPNLESPSLFPLGKDLAKSVPLLPALRLRLHGASRARQWREDRVCRPIPGEDATAISLSLALPVVLESGGPQRGEKQQRSARPVGRKEGAGPGLAEGTSPGPTRFSQFSVTRRGCSIRCHGG